MMYEVNWCGIYMPIWLLCLILGGLLGVVLGKLVQLILRQTKLLTVDYESLAVAYTGRNIRLLRNLAGRDTLLKAQSRMVGSRHNYSFV